MFAMTGSVAAVLMTARARLQGRSARAVEALAAPVDVSGLSAGRRGMFESRHMRLKWAVVDENERWDEIVRKFQTRFDRAREEVNLRR